MAKKADKKINFRQKMWQKFKETAVGKIMGNRYFKFSITTALYLLWVIWLGSWLWAIGILIIIDIYITFN